MGARLYFRLVTTDSALRLHIPGFLLALMFLIALGFYLIWPPDRVARTLLFPGTTEATLSGERRLVPRTRDDERAIELLVEEMLLGPARISHSRAVPRGTRVRNLMLRDATVYVDLSESAMLGGSEVRVDVRTGLRAITESISYNFRNIEEIVLTIDGNEPFAPAYRPVGR